jgi:hypothetical protein
MEKNLRHGERQRPEPQAKSILIKAQVADAPHFVTLTQGLSGTVKILSNQKEQMPYLFDLP